VGWAPLPPEAEFHEGSGIEFDVNLIPARSYCFVPEQHFTEPVRPATVIVNNITIVNKTVNITNIRVVNKTIINEGPAPQRIEQATGHTVPVTRSAELRQRLETRVSIKPKPAAARVERPEEKPKPAVTKVEEPKPAVTKVERPVEKPKPEEKKIETRPVAAKPPERPEKPSKPAAHPAVKPPARKPGSTNEAEIHRAPEKRPGE
jgi:hypothetical protein